MQFSIHPSSLCHWQNNIFLILILIILIIALEGTPAGIEPVQTQQREWSEQGKRGIGIVQERAASSAEVMITVDSRYLGLGYLENPTISNSNQFPLPLFFSHLLSAISNSSLSRNVFRFPWEFKIAGVFCILQITFHHHPVNFVDKYCKSLNKRPGCLFQIKAGGAYLRGGDYLIFYKIVMARW